MFILNYISVLINATASFFWQLPHWCVTEVHNLQVHINIPQVPQLWFWRYWATPWLNHPCALTEGTN